MGVVGGFGTGVEALRDALAGDPAGAAAAATSEDSGGESSCRHANTTVLESFVDRKALRRMDTISRLAILGACLALRDAGVERPDERMGVALATGYGPSGTTLAFLDSFIDSGDACSSPTQFSSSVHNAPAANLSTLLGVTGPNLTVSQFEVSASSALLTAILWLEEGRVDRVLVGGVDEYGDVLGYCWKRLFGESGATACLPLDTRRQTARPGEGCAFLLLERPSAGQRCAGVIEAVHMGRAGGAVPPISADRLLILGADGHRRCASAYTRLVPPGSAVTSFGHLWGSFPTATAFDAAAATVLLQSGRTPAPPPGTNHPEAWRVPAAGEPLPPAGIGLLRVAAGGEYALTLMAKA
ncbi:MAG: beta-ketoacyl synthase N-terminal-like domain-containing protein [Candidatus Geothermincolia bacterium]